jgi:molecular chaperone DnaK (HSP70)
LPVSVTVTVGTYKPNQSFVRVRIIEGEAQDISEAKVVCTCVVDQLPKNLPRGSQFDLSLTYDADGLIQVVAAHRDSTRIGSASIHWGVGPAPQEQQEEARPNHSPHQNSDDPTALS